MITKFLIIKEHEATPDFVIGGGDKAIMRMLADMTTNNERVEKLLEGASEINALFSLLDHDNVDWQLADDGITIMVPEKQYEKACNELPLQTLRERYGYSVQSVIK